MTWFKLSKAWNSLISFLREGASWKARMGCAWGRHGGRYSGPITCKTCYQYAGHGSNNLHPNKLYPQKPKVRGIRYQGTSRVLSARKRCDAGVSYVSLSASYVARGDPTSGQRGRAA